MLDRSDFVFAGKSFFKVPSSNGRDSPLTVAARRSPSQALLSIRPRTRRAVPALNTRSVQEPSAQVPVSIAEMGRSLMTCCRGREHLFAPFCVVERRLPLRRHACRSSTHSVCLDVGVGARLEGHGSRRLKLPLGALGSRSSIGSTPSRTFIGRSLPACGPPRNSPCAEGLDPILRARPSIMYRKSQAFVSNALTCR